MPRGSLEAYQSGTSRELANVSGLGLDPKSLERAGLPQHQVRSKGHAL